MQSCATLRNPMPSYAILFNPMQSYAILCNPMQSNDLTPSNPIENSTQQSKYYALASQPPSKMQPPPAPSPATLGAQHPAHDVGWQNLMGAWLALLRKQKNNAPLFFLASKHDLTVGVVAAGQIPVLQKETTQTKSSSLLTKPRSHCEHCEFGLHRSKSAKPTRATLTNRACHTLTASLHSTARQIVGLCISLFRSSQSRSACTWRTANWHAEDRFPFKSHVARH